MINRAEPRACGHSRRSRRLDTKWPETAQRQLLRQTKLARVSEGCRRTGLASNRTGENPPSGMNRGGGGNVGRTWWPFATMPERADTTEAIGLNRARLRSTRPVSISTAKVPFSRSTLPPRRLMEPPIHVHDTPTCSDRERMWKLYGRVMPQSDASMQFPLIFA
jgi:hypothetical protein